MIRQCSICKGHFHLSTCFHPKQSGTEGDPMKVQSTACDKCCKQYNIPTKNDLHGIRKKGSYGCGTCGWIPTGCPACQIANITNPGNSPLPPGKLMVKQSTGKYLTSPSRPDDFNRLNYCIGITSGPCQSDSQGYGLTAKVDIPSGSKFRDHTTEFVGRDLGFAKAHYGEYVGRARSRPG